MRSWQTLFSSVMALSALACGTSPNAGGAQPAQSPDASSNSGEPADAAQTGADATVAADGAHPVDGAASATDGRAPAAEAGPGGGPADAAAADTGSGDGGAAAPPGVRIVGRTVAGTNGATRFEWSGVNLAARFTGTQVSIELADSANANEFEVLIDGNRMNKLITTSGTTTYPLATGLANGTHDLLLWRRTEASYGFTDFVGLTGFGAGGALLAPPAAPDRRIEIVGDSISCGYGVEGDAGCTSDQLESIENNYVAYGSVAARALDADVVTVAWSGIGVYRNYNEVGPSTNTMPQRYDFAIPTDTTTTWNFSQYQPQAVVINLTSNDFSTMGDPGTPYIDAFVTFVDHIRGKYPQAYIVLLIEWRGNGSDSAPDVNRVVSTVQSGGDTNIESFDIRPFANGNACQGHPDIAGQQAMGGALATELKRVMGW